MYLCNSGFMDGQIGLIFAHLGSNFAHFLFRKKKRESEQHKSGSGAKTPTKWRFFPLMSFLDKVIEAEEGVRDSSLNFNDENEGEEQAEAAPFENADVEPHSENNSDEGGNGQLNVKKTRWFCFSVNSW